MMSFRLSLIDNNALFNFNIIHVCMVATQSKFYFATNYHLELKLGAQQLP